MGGRRFRRDYGNETTGNGSSEPSRNCSVFGRTSTPIQPDGLGTASLAKPEVPERLKHQNSLWLSDIFQIKRFVKDLTIERQVLQVGMTQGLALKSIGLLLYQSLGLAKTMVG